jgi:Bacterial TniB protein
MIIYARKPKRRTTTQARTRPPVATIVRPIISIDRDELERRAAKADEVWRWLVRRAIWATILDLQIQALRSLKRMDVKLLMPDDVHNILAGSAKEQRVLLNTHHYLSNKLKVSLVCLGISDAG